MAENVTIAGATYSEVQQITAPTSDGGNAKFVDSDLIPTKVSQLENDARYLTEGELSDAVDDALFQAKESGEFDGKDGEDGEPGIYYGTTEPTGDNKPIWIDPSGDETVELVTKEELNQVAGSIPLKTSQLTNDSGYVTSLGADYILEAGTKNGWKWEKWNSGKYICYGIFTDTCTHYTIVTPFYGFYSTSFPYPITFPEPPIVLFNCKIGNGFGMPAGDVMRSSSAVRCYALSTAKDTVTCVWEILVIGRWK